MTFKIFNTMTRKKEIFEPLKDREVRMYTCGPTVYDFAHIGNFRAYIFADLLAKWLKFKGFKVKHLMNITDVDDKIIKRAQEQGTEPMKIAQEFEKLFHDDRKKVGIDSIDIFADASKHIPEIISQVKRLIQKGFAYRTETGVYFDITKFKKYGKLSHQNLSELKVHRVEPDPTKKNEGDFALWKANKSGEIFWNSPWGKGRPGWHIEDTALAEKYLGTSYDIHSGGVDLIFPHHEAEIAQMESLTGKNLANYWVHNEHLLVEGMKMSKSLGNFITLHELLEKGYDPVAIRFLLLSTHYRQQLNFTYPSLQATKNSLEKIYDFIRRLDEVKGAKHNPDVDMLIKHSLMAFEDKMDDDLKINEALVEVFKLINKINLLIDEKEIDKKDAKNVREFLLTIDKVLGLKLNRIKKEKISPTAKKLIAQREKARKAGDFATADKIREELFEKYRIILEDTPEGVKWKRA